MMAAGDRGDTLFDPHFLARLQALVLRIDRAGRGGRLAEQRTDVRGQGSDFADYKPYTPGDDLRTIDWNIFRRLNKAFVRTFEERQNLPVYLVADTSGSMTVETPSRLDAARRALLAIGAVALRQNDAVTLIPVAGEARVVARNLSGRANVIRLAQALADMPGGGTTALAQGLSLIAAMGLRRGLLVVASDFFDPEGLERVLPALGQLPHRLLLVQMTRASDADPALSGDVVIDGGEDAGTVALSVTPAMLAEYRRLYAGFCAALSDFAASRGARLVRIDADADVLDQLAPVLSGTLAG